MSIAYVFECVLKYCKINSSSPKCKFGHNSTSNMVLNKHFLYIKLHNLLSKGWCKKWGINIQVWITYLLSKWMYRTGFIFTFRQKIEDRSEHRLLFNGRQHSYNKKTGFMYTERVPYSNEHWKKSMSHYKNNLTM